MIKPGGGVDSQVGGESSASGSLSTESTSIKDASGYDGYLIDLDGTLFAGSRPIEGATAAVEHAVVPIRYVTNNASRSPQEVAAHLNALGFPATKDEVMTSSQAAVRMLESSFATGGKVLVVGTDAFRALVREAGFVVVSSADDHPDAVVQGHSPTTAWPELAEAALSIRGGALWIASNVDTTLPSERGLLPGNGSMVAAVQCATGAEPAVAGKPAAGVLQAAAFSCSAARPLVVGDRLDTDIAGAVAAKMDSLLVLTGVSGREEAIAALSHSRPTFIANSLDVLGGDLEPYRLSCS